MSLNKFFHCKSTLAKIEKCGYLKPYLDPFADWLAKQHFTESCVRKHIRNIVHFSYFLQETEHVDFYDLSKHMDAFVLEHIRAHCRQLCAVFLTFAMSVDIPSATFAFQYPLSGPTDSLKPQGPLKKMKR